MRRHLQKVWRKSWREGNRRDEQRSGGVEWLVACATLGPTQSNTLYSLGPTSPEYSWTVRASSPHRQASSARGLYCQGISWPGINLSHWQYQGPDTWQSGLGRKGKRWLSCLLVIVALILELSLSLSDLSLVLKIPGTDPQGRGGC